MPNKHASYKHWQQTKKRTVRNKAVKGKLKNLVKDSRKFLTAKEKAKAAENIKKAVKALDKAAQNGVIKKNKASRLKSRLMKQLSKLK